MENTRVLVTGGAGYVGSLLTGELLSLGHKVHVVDNLRFGITPLLHYFPNENFSFNKIDVRSYEILKKELETFNPEYIIHLAAIVGYPACAADEILAKTTNVGGTNNVVEICKDIGLKTGKYPKLLYASTGSAYGKVEGICTEETPINPLTLYGETKRDAENLVMKNYPGESIALRFATVFGVSPRLRLDLLINDFTYQALYAKQIVLFEGNFKRTFLHVRDTVNSYLHCMKNWDKMKNEVYNVGDSKMNYSKKQVAEIIKNHIDYYLHEAPVGEDLDKRDYEVDYSKINKTGFNSQISIDSGIQELVKTLKHIKITPDWKNA